MTSKDHFGRLNHQSDGQTAQGSPWIFWFNTDYDCMFEKKYDRSNFNNVEELSSYYIYYLHNKSTKMRFKRGHILYKI